ncbi:hypothetical protein KPL71_003832 [Citrus sinensis]|uniref:Uncharacterized protein n=1 Tax=Citrus sinensis TaxID=2711 RepID=A0ACB8N1J9_CITSI|nr:hypothetical protein KPL71_003832 [Citrus sinensis]
MRTSAQIKSATVNPVIRNRQDIPHTFSFKNSLYLSLWLHLIKSPMASTVSASSATLLTVIFFLNLHFLCSTSEPVISASPAILPYVNAPDMSSFFPSPTSQNSEAFAPAPSSGEFIGKSSSCAAKSDGGLAIIAVRICTVFVMILALC